MPPYEAVQVEAKKNATIRTPKRGPAKRAFFWMGLASEPHPLPSAEASGVLRAEPVQGSLVEQSAGRAVGLGFRARFKGFSPKKKRGAPY